jgi:hypothetical protein
VLAVKKGSPLGNLIRVNRFMFLTAFIDWEV